jgi:hypothetical protein
MFMDDEVIGFGVQVRETGSKSFTRDYIFDGRRRPLYIADFLIGRQTPRENRGSYSICCGA